MVFLNFLLCLFFLLFFSEYRNGIDIRPLRGSEGVEDHQITVCVRKRPLNKKGMV